MRGSTDRILTTHVGSLPRNDRLSDLLTKREAGEAYDVSVFEAEMDQAVRHVIGKQAAAGIDIGNDGEQQRVGFQTYIPERMSGFGGESKRKIGKDFQEVPELIEQFLRRFPKRSKISNAPQAVGEVRYLDTKDIKEEVARFKAHAGGSKPGFAETFATAPSPGIVATTMINQHYDSHEAYLGALATALGNEYRAIYEAGHVLQVDSPDLAMERHRFFGHLDERAFLEQLELLAGQVLGVEGEPGSVSARPRQARD